jgi:cytochrome c556
MPRTSTIAFATVATLLAACASTKPAETQTPPARPAPESSERMASEEVDRPFFDIHNVMQAKVSYSAALLQAIAMQDFGQLERNAEELRRLSFEAAFIVHDTVAYRAMSETFRGQISSLAEHARRGNQQAVEEDYRRIVDSCFRCHAYVREERFKGALPGRISMR